MSDAETGPNAAQIAYWNSEAGPRWVAMQERMDALLAPLLHAALERARPEAGERVLDIGCGCGATLLELAGRIGSGGSVLGVDVSAPMLGRARERVQANALAHVRLTLSDAATHAFAPGAFNLAFSRFGVMFFDDPVGAFANIRTALAATGRLVFVCWAPAAGQSLVAHAAGRCPAAFAAAAGGGPECARSVRIRRPRSGARHSRGGGLRHCRYCAPRCRHADLRPGRDRGGGPFRGRERAGRTRHGRRHVGPARCRRAGRSRRIAPDRGSRWHHTARQRLDCLGTTVRGRRGGSNGERMAVGNHDGQRALRNRWWAARALPPRVRGDGSFSNWLCGVRIPL
jgi:SAM-dependent methyltransferase